MFPFLLNPKAIARACIVACNIALLKECITSNFRLIYRHVTPIGVKCRRNLWLSLSSFAHSVGV
jgi:hypothetical protein